MSTSHLADAEASLIKEREDLLAQLARVDAILSQIHGVPRTVGDRTPVTPGEYAGMGRSEAFRAYLTKRRGRRIPLETVARDLLLGGVECGKPRKAERDPEKILLHNLKLVMLNRKNVFQRDDNWVVWLAPAADEPQKKGTMKKH